MAEVLTKLLGKSRYENLTVKQLDKITAVIDKEITENAEIQQVLAKRIDRYRK